MTRLFSNPQANTSSKLKHLKRGTAYKGEPSNPWFRRMIVGVIFLALFLIAQMQFSQPSTSLLDSLANSPGPKNQPPQQFQSSPALRGSLPEYRYDDLDVGPGEESYLDVYEDSASGDSYTIDDVSAKVFVSADDGVADPLSGDGSDGVSSDETSGDIGADFSQLDDQDMDLDKYANGSVLSLDDSDGMYVDDRDGSNEAAQAASFDGEEEYEDVDGSDERSVDSVVAIA